MFKKMNSATTSAAANGGSPIKKRARLEVDDVFSASDDDEEVHDSALISAKGDPGPFNEALLKTVQAAARPNVHFKAFDFGSINIKGHSGEELRAQYDRLRKAALQNVRHLPIKREVEFIRQYAKSALTTSSDAPKRPRTAYLRFLAEYRPKLIKKHPELAKNVTGTMERLAGAWKNLSVEKRRPFQEAYEKEMAEFYRLRPDLLKAKNAAAKRKGATATRKRLPAPKSAFDLFADAKTQEYSEKYQLKGAELQQKLASKFQKLSDRKRQKWENRAREAMDEYLQALSNKEGSQTATKEPASVEVVTDDPILAQSPVDKKEKSKHKKTAPSTDTAYENYLDRPSADDPILSPQTPRSSQGSTKKQTKASVNRNSWLD